MNLCSLPQLAASLVELMKSWMTATALQSSRAPATREWLDTGLEPERAEDLARHHAEPVDAFEWYEVGKEVGNVKNKGPGLIRATATPTQQQL